MSEKLKSIISNLELAKQKVEQLKRETVATAKLEFERSIKDIFEYIPRLKAISWLQYSPHFNDGDECIFGIRGINALSFVPERVGYEYENLTEGENHFIESGDGYSSYNTKSLKKEELETINALMSFIEVNEDLMEDLFGNHVSVLVTADGIEVEEYEHD